ncbi:MAG: glycosyltransferase [Rhodobacteraceae bacterium]|nr:glycosyltransferase [Paracoccaceae bacterium]
MTSQRASVIVVSRGRPAALARCLTALEQQNHPCFEIIVVADPEGLAAAGRVGRIKRVSYDLPNISAARNLGLAEAAGEFVAFIDDDAVAEPQWLARLTAALDSAQAAGGYVRGRNGISFQWQGCEVSTLGWDHAIELPEAGAVLRPSAAGRAVKTQGTNMAFRRDILANLGGFDPGYEFYFDEADLNLRMAATGVQTAVVPGAQVHHGFHASSRRKADRTPRDLTQIGASLAVLARRHGANTEKMRAAHTLAQQQRLLDYKKAGKLNEKQIKELMAGFTLGFSRGLARALDELVPLTAAQTPFLPYIAQPAFSEHIVLAGRGWQARRLRRQAKSAVESGKIVSLYLFWPDTRYHHRIFNSGGWWEQVGGLFGRSLRKDPVFQYWRFDKRLRRESEWNGLARLP